MHSVAPSISLGRVLDTTRTRGPSPRFMPNLANRRHISHSTWTRSEQWVCARCSRWQPQTWPKCPPPTVTATCGSNSSSRTTPSPHHPQPPTSMPTIYAGAANGDSLVSAGRGIANTATRRTCASATLRGRRRRRCRRTA